MAKKSMQKKSKSVKVDEMADKIDLIKETAGFDATDSLEKPGGLRALRSKLIPANLKAQIKKAKSYRENNDFMQPLIETLQDFGAAGFENLSPDNPAKKYYDNICRENNMDGIVLRMWDSLLTTSNIIFHYKLEENSSKNSPTVEYIMTFDPELTEVVPMFGDMLVFVEPDTALKDLVLRAGTDQERERLKDIPEKWQLASRGSGMSGMRHKGQVLISEDDDEYTIVRNTQGREDRLVKPNMCAIFDALQLRDLLIDGDYSVAYLIKNCITLVRAGETITGGPKTGSRANWAKNKDLLALKEQFRTPSKTIRIYGNHTVTIDFVFPDIGLFNPTKYNAVERRILMWAGISLGLMVGDGGNYATLYVNIKKLIAKIRKNRKIIGRLIEKFYMDIKPSWIKKDNVPKVRWDETLLKEPRQLLQEVTTLLKSGLSIESAFDTFDHDYETELARNKAADKNKKWFIPIYEPGQGMSMLRWPGGIPGTAPKVKDGEPGRPEGTQPTPPEKGPSSRQPRPSTADFLEMSIADTITAVEGTDLEPDFAPFKSMPTGSAALKLWERVYRGALKRGASVKSAAMQAWSVVGKFFKKVEGKWVKKEKADAFTIIEISAICFSSALSMQTKGLKKIELDEDFFKKDAVERTKYITGGIK